MRRSEGIYNVTCNHKPSFHEKITCTLRIFLCRIQNLLKNGFEISFYKNNKTEFFMLRYLLRKRVLSIKGIKVWYSRTLRPCLTKYIKFGSKCSKSLILVYTKNSMSNLILVDLQKKISGNVC